MIDTAKVVEVFCAIDGFCLQVKEYFASHPSPAGLEARHPAGRKPSLSESEVFTILTLYHLSGFKCFQYYYQRLVLGELSSYFPRAVSYTHFLALSRQALLHAFLVAHYRAGLSAGSGHYYIDSKKLPVCDNRRIHSHKVFGDVATRGKGSSGRFFGLKLHLVINEQGQLARFLLTPVNVADNNPRVLSFLLPGLKGKCYGDKGYLTSLFEQLLEKGLHLVTKVRRNMKNRLLTLSDKLNLLKRGSIEAVNDILMTVCNIDHTRHRNPLNALAHIFSGLSAYTFLDQTSPFKPARIHA